MIPALFADVSPSTATAGFWQAAARGELAIQRCEACGRLQHPPRATCTTCGATALAFDVVSGVGTVYSYTVVQRALISELRGAVPYVLGLVDLREGVRLMSLLRINPDQSAVGVSVCVDFEQITPEFALPVFRLTEGLS